MTSSHSKAVTGMGIRQGITLIVGGGFHGKSTLLEALKCGVYNHIPGDGREFVVAQSSSVAIRAEDGRSVQHTDLSTFIKNLPQGKDTTAFSTPDASGSTSQAANTIEAVEAGATCLLLDEDTCATNFMIRDQRMSMLVAQHLEPITPFLHKVRDLYTTNNISSILVIGGAGDYFDVADAVVAMNSYVPADVTAKAKDIARQVPGGMEGSGLPFGAVAPRTPVMKSVDTMHEGREKVKVFRKEQVAIGSVELDLSAVCQCLKPGQNPPFLPRICSRTRVGCFVPP